MLGIKKVDENRPKNSQVLMQMENFTLTEQLRVFHCSWQEDFKSKGEGRKKYILYSLHSIQGAKVSGVQL